MVATEFEHDISLEYYDESEDQAYHVFAKLFKECKYPNSHSKFYYFHYWVYKLDGEVSMSHKEKAILRVTSLRNKSFDIQFGHLHEWEKYTSSEVIPIKRQWFVLNEEPVEKVLIAYIKNLHFEKALFGV